MTDSLAPSETDASGRPRLSSSPPEALLNRIRGGDPEALQELVHRYTGGLTDYVSGFLLSEDDAEDVVQETFVRIWEHRGRWGPRGSARAYVYQTARNLALTRLRHLSIRNRKEPEIRRRAGTAPTPDEVASYRELKRAFEAAVANLPERRREAFLLVRVQGLSLAETAETMGVTKRTVANHVYMALTELAERLRVFLP